MVRESVASQTLLLRGEVVEISQRDGRRLLTVALEPHSLVASAGRLEDTHLGDRVRLEAEVRVVKVISELPADAAEGRPSARRPVRTGSAKEER